MNILSLLAATKTRLINYNFPVLFEGSLNIPSQLPIAIGIIVLSFLIDNLCANTNGLKHYGWKIGLILAAFFLSLFIVLFGEYKLGVDLKDGAILVFELDEAETKALNPRGRFDEWRMPELSPVL